MRLSDDDWTTLEIITKSLEIFRNIQIFMEAENYVTISLIPFAVSFIREQLYSTMSSYKNSVVDSDQRIYDLICEMTRIFHMRFGHGTFIHPSSETSNFSEYTENYHETETRGERGIVK